MHAVKVYCWWGGPRWPQKTTISDLEAIEIGDLEVIKYHIYYALSKIAGLASVVFKFPGPHDAGNKRLNKGSLICICIYRQSRVSGLL